MLVIGLTLVVGGVLGIVRYRPAEPHLPNPRPVSTATVYVGGSKGEAYWMQWGDFSGALEGRKEGVVGDKSAAYEIDLSTTVVISSHDELLSSLSSLSSCSGTFWLRLDAGAAIPTNQVPPGMMLFCPGGRFATTDSVLRLPLAG
jgi:hypothetical protein